ncbi:potassium-transporting ATPase subunit KdpA [Myroides odoratus]|uniref:Potassium-transporting ATPase potassium-binding subunit n=1 Tax=Myroides odoratus TaxID=256 RepID=A0A9Q6Z2L1_MYROD|nr:potassium-transporting ATPase subunit KdpA [Myroides odoratus]EHQ41068.1 Potassium-transporting ATPase A chain [Myroides odoratus DSM 2801]EKB08300.1 potassium-transporting ATPase A chain [Myroides odoratus CIP 103059]QQT98522.1 potassium-transporting ATPase subunit KdpA [Myroides odoratus]WQD59307.1 potassium-transporting ATPase subunit KdpA [Myroides odoratus]STZ32102.1 potassium-transporting ATPase subunit A [Myroides odoratus]
MNTEIIGILVTFLVAIGISIPLGKYIAKVYAGQPTFLDTIMSPLEQFCYKSSRIKPEEGMNWKQHLVALLTLNAVWFVVAFILLLTQGSLPLNPDHNPSMSPDLAFNTAISFLVNCNLQHYAGETGATYLAQLALMFLQFVSAATGMAAAVALFEAFRNKTTTLLGNFYVYFVKSITRILLPLSVIVAAILIFQGTPMTFEGKDTITTLEGQQVEVSRGPAAAFIAIKHLGTNGGGFFGTNSAHPFENPTYLTNMVEMIAQLIIPLAMIFAFGYYINRKRFSWMMFGVMTLGFLCLAIPNVVMEANGNPNITAMGIDNSLGAMEGKEVRIGAAASGFWSIVTTVISTGSVNSMHDSTMPLSGMNQLLAMMINAFYGGVGVGILNFFVFIVLAVFISGLMVGRTPELFGKKIEAKEMKIAMVIALIHPFLILSSTALGAAFPEFTKDTLNNPSFHGFSEILYEYTSSAANNGSGFEGLGDNTPWWNFSTGIILLLGRFLPIIGPVALAGCLAQKRYVPESAGTLATDTTTFGMIVFTVILIVAALAFFPVLTLGPIADYFTILSL